MIEDDQNAVRNRHNGFLLATTTRDPVILSREIVVPGMRDRPDDLGQNGFEVGIALSGGTTESFPPTLLIARTHACPRGEMLIGGEARHICADFAQDGGSSRFLNADDALGQGHRFLKRAQVLLNLLLYPLEGPFEKIDMGQNALQ